ncbi:MAG TPA: Swt1 family HEPN domain-containing protein [Candidatus Hydrogenedentes bacterium]|nr:Swt1 family HEPN domain-containing protein [Candidatus Hydrogenedentota bacterium]HQM51365.1 Swt1 family HEPN domain-containing protein [Candidatus Hydrogenedentota bacterium]
MALSNAERVGKALDALKEGLVPFAERELQTAFGKDWLKEAKKCFTSSQKSTLNEKKYRWDTYTLLHVVNSKWHDVFGKVLSKDDRGFVIELQGYRNRWAHEENFSTDDALRALDTVQRLLASVSAPESAEVARMRQELMRNLFSEQARYERRRSSATAIEGQPAAGLKPWRDVMTPHPDVASGRYQQAEFAADLAQVSRGEGEAEYRDAAEFFARTFLTDGLRELLVNATRRLSGNGGDPVVELQTNFGGGKTHSMLALYHLFSGRSAKELPGADVILEGAKIPQPPVAKRAVLVGTAISPGQPDEKDDGTVVHTLWGDMAWQLLGKKGYALVKEADEKGVSPGSKVLVELFRKCGSALVLIDEWVAYLRQFHEGIRLPGGTLESNLTFVQSLTEAAKSVADALLVASLPESDIEIGGEYGQKALEMLKNIFGRIESPWRPASAEESFEIVRRRLFQPLAPEKYPLRDNVLNAFSRMYQEQPQEFPSVCREQEYRRRLENSYPIHPELFDRLYEDWSSMDKFQRTRGVLRIMASVIHVLWERQDPGLLIMPSSIPLDDLSVQPLLTYYLEDPWIPVIERDIDGHNSLPLELDRENPNLGRYSATRRVSRTIFMGSAPLQHSANKGLEDRQIRLGCAQPGESVATFGDSLRRLTDRAYHLYVEGNRYWYSTQQTVLRLAQDRALQYDRDTVLEEVEKRLRKEAVYRGDFTKVHACPNSSGDVPDDRETRLVILRPENCHSSNNEASPGRLVAAELLEKHGNGPRHYRNALVFLAADKARLTELEQAVRQYLAWVSIGNEVETLNLDAAQARQAVTKREQADETVKQRIPETYQWLLVPAQSSPTDRLEWQQVRLQGQEALAVRASRKLKTDGILVDQMAGVTLRLELDRVPLWRGAHVEIRQLIDDFAQYTYLPKLKNPDVLLAAVQDGVQLLTWQEDAFAYASGWDEAKERYSGLRVGVVTSIIADPSSLVVKAGVAARQLEIESKAVSHTGTTKDADSGHDGGGGVGVKAPNGVVKEPTPKELPPKRFHGSVSVDPERLGKAAGTIAEEVVQHMQGLVGSNVEITIEITAEYEKGFPEKVIRTVNENCQTLKFKSHGFEKE